MNAYANAPWTLPSHATLFTGLLPRQHGVGSRTMRAGESLETLAERLQAAGYETVGYSENEFVSPEFNLTQGFDRFQRAGSDDGTSVLADFLSTWLAQRKPGRPFFLFVNVMDAHEPYQVRRDNPFVPAGTTPEAIAAVDLKVHEQLCDRLGSESSIAILRGLYLGDVAAADGKLHQVLELLSKAKASDSLITIATADHGEHFGEHKLMEHNFSVREAVLHVPLVVSGLPGVAPAVVEQPVQLADVMPSVLRWSGLELPDDLAGRVLPTNSSLSPNPPVIAAEYTEPDHVNSQDYQPEWLQRAQSEVEVRRRPCAAGYPVFGDMAAIIRYPYKLIWFERYPAELYDISKDPREATDLAAARPDLVMAMGRDVSRLQARSLERERQIVELSPEERATMARLGYLENPDAR